MKELKVRYFECTIMLENAAVFGAVLAVIVGISSRYNLIIPQNRCGYEQVNAGTSGEINLDAMCRSVRSANFNLFLFSIGFLAFLGAMLYPKKP